MSTSSTDETKNSAAVTAAFLLVVLIAALSVFLLRPTAAVSESAPPEDFSSARAMKHLREIAKAPRPTGSEHHARSREYIVRELNALGANAEVHETVTLQMPRRAGGITTVARVKNIVARVPGKVPGKAVMLAAHYDSVPTAPGATDDGAGVAALLETMRALKTRESLRNGLIVLITDAEELGLIGAHAFVDEHPWMRDVEVALNFEGRGNSGPSMMFETSKGNRALIRELANAAPHVIANSLMFAVYERLPNDTDMTVFKRGGAQGLNFAYANEVTHYHTALDSVEEIDESSLQHHGSYALALARQLGNLDLNGLRSARDAVYFNILGSLFVHYSENWIWPLTILATVVFLFVFIDGLRGRKLTIRGSAAGFAAFVLCSAFAALVVTLFWWLVRKVHSGFEFLTWGEPYNAWLYELGFVGLTIGSSAAIYALLSRRRVGMLDLLAGALFWWLTLLLLSSALLPLASFLFVWPLLLSSIGLGFVLSAQAARGSNAKIAAVTLTALPAVALMSPLIHLFFVMLGLKLSAGVMVLVVLLATLVLPLFALMQARAARKFTAAVLLIAVTFIVAGVATAGFDSKSRKANSVFYYLNANTREAYWISADTTLDEWTTKFIANPEPRQSLATIFPWSTQDVWRSQAVSLPLNAPTVTVSSDVAGGDFRQVALRVITRRSAPMILLHVDPEMPILEATAEGKTLRSAGDVSTDPLRLAFIAPRAEGVEVILRTKPGLPLKLTVQDVSYELPPIAAEIGPRPADTMPLSSFRASETTVVGGKFVF